MEIQGFLGTRADIIVDTVIVASALLPFYMMYTFYLAAKGKIALHKRLQEIALFAVAFLVIALEADVQFSNLSEVSALSGYHGTTELTVVFVIHLIFAVSTFIGWTWLVFKSGRIYPEGFGEFNHKKWGKIIFADIIMTAVTGWILYAMVFIY